MARKALPDEERRSATIGVSVRQDERDEWHEAARARGMLLAELIRRAVSEYLRRHKLPQ